MNEEQRFVMPQELIDTLRTARHVVVLTGAGISAESGLPTFRDRLTGLWAQYKPEELSTPQAFRHNPGLVWEWHAELRRAMAEAVPNAGHLALAQMEQKIPQFTLLTQNIDGLHQRAGSRNVIELHGNIARTKCADEDVIVEAWEETGEIPPRCPHCRGLLRPDVVWFGEMLPKEALALANTAAKECDVFFSIGTSGVVEPAASLAYRAMEKGATVVIINLDVQTNLSSKYYKIHAAAGIILPILLQAWSTED
ncbi:MAG: NAD-dependent deacylase [Anaerolineae bacterium]|nr:NAD-dependent deacylase [Anaerolineae bacterium]